jgi:hypothetical protein
MAGYAVYAACGQQDGQSRKSTDQPHPLTGAVCQISCALFERLRLVEWRQGRLLSGGSFDGRCQRHWIIVGANQKISHAETALILRQVEMLHLAIRHGVDADVAGHANDLGAHFVAPREVVSYSRQYKALADRTPVEVSVRDRLAHNHNGNSSFPIARAKRTSLK